MEYSWGHKYQDDIAKKTREIDSLKTQFIEKIEKIRQQYQSEINDLKTSFRDDVIIIDKELNKQIGLKREATGKNEELQSKVNEMVTLL